MRTLTVAPLCPPEAVERIPGTVYPTFVHAVYPSKTTGRERGMNLLLPAGYGKTEGKRYPTLYLLHGIFGDEFSIPNDPGARVAELAVNLAGAGLAREMIVVFPHLFASADPDLQPGFTDEQVAPYDHFLFDLADDLVPYMEAHYALLPGRENRAVAGFSMGGREALFIALQRPDLFAYGAAMSPAPGLLPTKDFAMTHPGQLTEETMTYAVPGYEAEMLMISCGTKDGISYPFAKSYHQTLHRNGVAHLWYEVPGADHESTALRSGLYNFMRTLF